MGDYKNYQEAALAAGIFWESLGRKFVRYSGAGHNGKYIIIRWGKPCKTRFVGKSGRRPKKDLTHEQVKCFYYA